MLLILVVSPNPETTEFTRKLASRNSQNLELDVRDCSDVQAAVRLMGVLARQHPRLRTRVLLDCGDVETNIEGVRKIVGAEREGRIDMAVLARAAIGVVVGDLQEKGDFYAFRNTGEIRVSTAEIVWRWPKHDEWEAWLIEQPAQREREQQ